MKKYAVIGNPVEHSLSPKLHNYWIKKHKINAFYEKYLLKENEKQLNSGKQKFKEAIITRDIANR